LAIGAMGLLRNGFNGMSVFIIIDQRVALIVAFAMGGGIAYYSKSCLLEFFESRIILSIVF